MYGIHLACGDAARRGDGGLAAFAGEDTPRARVLRPVDDIGLALASPRGEAPVHRTDGGALEVALDGYFFFDAVPYGSPQSDHLRAFAELALREGLVAALGRIRAGSFVLVVFDVAGGTCAVANDRVGSIPVYHGSTAGGLIASTNPVALARAEGIDRAIDPIACASWALVGYTFGDRYFLEGIRVLPAASVLRWDSRSRRWSLEETGLGFYRRPPAGSPPDLDAIAGAVRVACERVASLPARTAHLQSGGMDSRLIAAAWPADRELPFFTYGADGSAEVHVAELVARERGAPFTHSLPGGDEVAGDLDSIFEATGLLVYPDREVISRQVRSAGFDAVTDGFAGDVYLGGSFYDPVCRLSTRGRLLRFIARFADRPASRHGLDELAARLYEHICELEDPQTLHGVLAGDFVEMLLRRRDDVLHDLRAEIERLLRAGGPANDSVALLYRDLLMTNRAYHATIQQAAICRRRVAVLFPLANDHDLMDLCLRLPPRAIAFRRLYIELFRRHFPRYGELPYGDSLLRLNRSPLAHRWVHILKDRLPWIPGLGERRRYLGTGPGNFARWLRESALLRERVAAMLREGGIADPHGLAARMARIGRGEEPGSGKLFHLAAISRWMRMARG